MRIEECTSLLACILKLIEMIKNIGSGHLFFCFFICFMFISGINFRKSVQKDESSLEFAPVNLHLQRLFGHNESLRRVKFYDIVTVGAFSANSLGFKQGGLLEYVIIEWGIPTCYSSIIFPTLNWL